MTGKWNIILFEVRVSVPDPSFCFILAFWPLVQLPSLSLINIVDPSFLMVLKKKMKISPSIFSLSNMRLWSTLIFYWNDKTSIKIKLTKQENRWWLDWETSPGLITVVWKAVPSNTEWIQWTFPSSENMESKTN